MLQSQSHRLLSSDRKKLTAVMRGFLFCCALLRPSNLVAAAARRTRLTWVNGIGYSMNHMIEGQAQISTMFGGKKVEFCHNPTSMASEDDMVGYLGDLTQAGAQKLGRVTEEVNMLVAHLKQAVTSVGKNGRVVHIAHSQGALVTALAAKRLTIPEMNRIEVLAFGGAAALRKTQQTPFHRCINYYSLNDPLLFVVPSAEQALRSGLIAQDEEFCFLVPRIGDPIADHQLLGPTYAQALAWEGHRFQRTYQSLYYRIFRWIALMIIHCLQWITSQLAKAVAAQDFIRSQTKKMLLYMLKSRKRREERPGPVAA